MKLVILDRDGTINEDRDDYVKSPDEWVPVPGALEAIARLNHAGWHTVIATNQSGLARGLFDMATLNAIHERMNRELAVFGGRIDAVFFCPHGPDDGCACRKPRPGLFALIGERYGIDLSETYVVGDAEPAAQIDVVRFIAESYHLPLPPHVPLESVHESLRADRRVDASRVLGALGVTLRHPSYREGMAPAATGMLPRP